MKTDVAKIWPKTDETVAAVALQNEDIAHLALAECPRKKMRDERVKTLKQEKKVSEENRKKYRSEGWG